MDEAVNVAAKHSWEAALLAAIVISAFSFIGWMLRQILKEARDRETRMATRIDNLDDREDKIHVQYNEQLSKLVETVTEALVKSTEMQSQLLKKICQMTDDMGNLCTLLKSCPCLLLKNRRGSFQITDENGKTLVTVSNGTSET